MKVILYKHGGCYNRGCEAIVRTTCKILEKNGVNDILVFSAHPEEDQEACLNEVVELKKSPTRDVSEIPLCLRGIAKIYNKLFRSEKLYYLLTSYPFHQCDFTNTIGLSIGGDHYCYAGSEQMLALHNSDVKKKGGKSVLWGCSVEPALLRKDVVKDMQMYDLIIARESITYEALKNKRIEHAYLYPDPAFVLPYVETDFSEIMSNNIVGVNISPYALGEGFIGLENYKSLIQWIQENTDMDVLLIPHVFKSHSNDLEMMDKLYDSLEDKNRVYKVEQRFNAEELKGIIRKCRFYVGARTHSTIAAYSSCVPTLVLGYSVKALGIAKDIFGTYENYVLSVQDLADKNELTKAFVWMYENEDSIKQHLNEFMPQYIENAWGAGERIRELI